MRPATTEPAMVPSKVNRPLKPAVRPRCFSGTLSAMIALHGELAKLLLNCRRIKRKAKRESNTPGEEGNTLLFNGLWDMINASWVLDSLHTATPFSNEGPWDFFSCACEIGLRLLYR